MRPSFLGAWNGSEALMLDCLYSKTTDDTRARGIAMLMGMGIGVWPLFICDQGQVSVGRLYVNVVQVVLYTCRILPNKSE